MSHQDQQMQPRNAPRRATPTHYEHGPVEPYLPTEPAALEPLPPGDGAPGPAELVQLRIRVVALENVVIALLAQTPGRRRDLVREMATYVEPAPGVREHPLTIPVAARMQHLVQRGDHFPL